MPDPKPHISNETEISVQDDRWDELGDIDQLAQSCVTACVQILKMPQAGELSIALIDDAQIQALNRDYRGKDKPTNVLSFPSDGFNPAMGDIVLAFETVSREAKDKGISIADHTRHLIVHGYLHLSGYDHESDDEAQTMEGLEIEILRSLGLQNPYQSS